jgi:hypothetical protein
MSFRAEDLPFSRYLFAAVQAANRLGQAFPAFPPKDRFADAHAARLNMAAVPYV